MFGSSKSNKVEKEAATSGLVKVGRVKQVRPGQIIEATAGKIPLALTNVDGTIYAFAAHCPHQAWPLWSGSMQGELVRCFLHRWQFNVRTGENIAPGDLPVCLPTYPVQLQGDEIWVDVQNATQNSIDQAK